MTFEKKHMSLNTKTIRPLIIILLLFVGQGCNLMQLKEDFKEAESSHVLVGIISYDQPNSNIPVVVGAYTKKGLTRTIAHYTTLHKPGPYELMVPTGTYTIVAFGDKNKNLVYDQGEPAGEILSETQIANPSGGVIGNLDIVLTDHQDAPHRITRRIYIPSQRSRPIPQHLSRDHRRFR